MANHPSHWGYLLTERKHKPSTCVKHARVSIHSEKQKTVFSATVVKLCIIGVVLVTMDIQKNGIVTTVKRTGQIYDFQYKDYTFLQYLQLASG